METTPPLEHFDEAYRSCSAPWVIGEPQPAIVELQRAGWIRSKVLDVGCGTGEHTILLTRLGYDVLGIDFAPHAVEAALVNAAEKGVDARFEVADAMNLGEPGYQTIVDSALFHIFDDADRARYVSSLHAAVRPGGLVHVLGWVLEALETTTYRGVVQEAQAEAIGLAVGTRVDEPAWLARARRR
jgi:SAM-dependent methyltransferase